MNTLNLDQVVLKDKEIILGGKRWSIPGELSVEHNLRLLEAHKKIEAEGETEENQREALTVAYDILKIRHPKLKFKQFTEMITMNQFIYFTAFVFGNFESTGEIDDAVNKAMGKAGKKKQTKRPSARSTRNRSTSSR